jgi:K+-transporting ATPase ATPase B chain
MRLPFTIASDVTKYFAILPALLVGKFGQMAPEHLVLVSPQSAVLSALFLMRSFSLH